MTEPENPSQDEEEPEALSLDRPVLDAVLGSGAPVEDRDKDAEKD